MWPREILPGAHEPIRVLRGDRNLSLNSSPIESSEKTILDDGVAKSPPSGVMVVFQDKIFA